MISYAFCVFKRDFKTVILPQISVSRFDGRPSRAAAGLEREVKPPAAMFQTHRSGQGGVADFRERRDARDRHTGRVRPFFPADLPVRRHRHAQRRNADNGLDVIRAEKRRHHFHVRRADFIGRERAGVDFQVVDRRALVLFRAGPDGIRVDRDFSAVRRRRENDRLRKIVLRNRRSAARRAVGFRHHAVDVKLHAAGIPRRIDLVPAPRRPIFIRHARAGGKAPRLAVGTRRFDVEHQIFAPDVFVDVQRKTLLSGGEKPLEDLGARLPSERRHPERNRSLARIEIVLERVGAAFAFRIRERIDVSVSARPHPKLQALFAELPRRRLAAGEIGLDGIRVEIGVE